MRFRYTKKKFKTALKPKYATYVIELEKEGVFVCPMQDFFQMLKDEDDRTILETKADSKDQDFDEIPDETTNVQMYLSFIKQLVEGRLDFNKVAKAVPSNKRLYLFELPGENTREYSGVDRPRFRWFIWLLYGNNILLGGGCYKDHFEDGDNSYQRIPSCNTAASDVSRVGNRLTVLNEANDPQVIIKDKVIEDIAYDDERDEVYSI